jgi:dipeptidyl aminopeptidase/acylaminoacyl peptidase
MGVDATGSANERLDAVSPAKHADKIRAPVLLVHGRDDTVVPIAQSQLMERALTDAGKTVQFVELEGEDHWLSGAKTRLEMLKALDAFLAEQLGT